MPNPSNRIRMFRILLTSIACFVFVLPLQAKEPLSPADLINIERVSDAEISPDGQHIAYTLRVPRAPDEEPGGSYYELYVADVESGAIRPFITGKENLYSIAWKPDGSAITFRSRRGDNKHTQVWMIPIDGGQARQITDHPSGVSAFGWHPNGDKLAYIAVEPKSERQKALKEKGYDFIYYEEEWKHRNLYMLDVNEELPNADSKQLTENITVWDFTFSPDGETIALSASDRNLIDAYYMFRKIHLLDLKSQSLHKLTDNPGKLGNYRFSPDGSHMAYAAAVSQKDHAVSQVFVIPVAGGEKRNLTKEEFKGHVNWVGWKDNNTVLYRAGEGTATTLSTVPLKGGPREVILSSQENKGIIFDPPSYTDDFKHFAFVGNTPYLPSELYYWQPGKEMRRLTNSNPWLDERAFGDQEVISYQARDGWTIEGLLIKPPEYDEDKTYPLVVFVHGGPEAHYSNGWVSWYSTPGQVLAGKGYLVFYPNYRASTGYGVEFAAAGYHDAAGKEFDDIADGIEYLTVEQEMADSNRVGLGGGSYGGFAAAWFASYYTDLVKASCMFVGISDLISKRGTTDIPYEELYVHSGEKLEKMWDQSLNRSPIYYAHQSATATLIFGGAEDTRVHPSQSIEFYRRLKMNNHPAVRLVQYPGEGHGNRKQPGRIDVLYRTIDWYDWYVKENNPIEGELPPLDISDKYGLDLPEKENAASK